MRPIAALAAVAWLALSGVGAAQPEGITREMIATALPEEGAPKAEPGPWQVVSEPAFGAPGFVVFRPSSLETFPGADTLPVVVWGNGGCALDGSRYAGFLTTIASHGFLVISTAAREGVPAGTRATVEDFKAALDWAEREHTRPGSPLNGRIEINRMAAMGQSCGGALSITIGADPRVRTIGVFNSGVLPANSDPARAFFPTVDVLKKLHGPVLLINGHERDFMMEASRSTFEAIDHVPVFYGARRNAGHTATAFHPGGGEFANVAWKWLRWQLKGDSEAGRMFAGRRCSLCRDPNWEVAAKGLD